MHGSACQTVLTDFGTLSTNYQPDTFPDYVTIATAMRVTAGALSPSPL